MRTVRIVALTATVVSCHLDKLLNAGGGAPPTSHGTPVQLVFAPVPRSARAGQPIGPVRVSVADSAGQPVAGVDTAMVTVALASNPGSATLSGNTSAHPVRGVATFTDLRLNKPGPGYALQAATDGLQSVTSDTFTVAPGPATELRFTVQPTNATQNAAITPPVEVSAYDSLGNKATNFTGQIRVALARGQAGSLCPSPQRGGRGRASASRGGPRRSAARLTSSSPTIPRPCRSARSCRRCGLPCTTRRATRSPALSAPSPSRSTPTPAMAPCRPPARRYR